MKRLIAIALMLVLCLSVFAGCKTEPAPVEAEPATIADAVAYIKTVYKNAAEMTTKDYERIGVVPVGDVKFDVEWTVDVGEDAVKVVRNENGMVTIDINEDSPEEVAYVLTATIKDAEGKTETLTWNHKLPATMNVDGMTYAEIVDYAYTLEDGIKIEDTYRLSGTIVKIDTPWSEDYKNITVTIAIAGKEDKPIMCYRLAGEGAADLAVGDVITVEGLMKNYKGTIEFDAGCILVGMGDIPDQKALLEAAFILPDGDALAYPSVMTGTVDKIVSAWSDQYGNITVDIAVEDKIVQAYRLSGEGAKDLAVGDRITVAGIIKNYKGTIEFDAGCVLVPNDSFQSVKNALSGYKLLESEAQETAKTITGTIANIDTAYSPDYQNITVTIVVGGLENYKIMCYRLAGEGAADLAVGDTITVTGILKNYKGTIEFDAGCALDAVVTGDAPVEPAIPDEPVVAPEDPAEIIADALALEAGAALPYECTLVGAVVSIDTEYSEQYGNITVTVSFGDTAIQCFRLKGEGAAELAVGDMIEVTGTISNYQGKVQFGAGSTFVYIDEH